MKKLSVYSLINFSKVNKTLVTAEIIKKKNIPAPKTPHGPWQSLVPPLINGYYLYQSD